MKEFGEKKLRIDKKSYRTLLMLAASVLALWWLFSNISIVLSWVADVFGILSPFITGLCIAFIVNIVLNPLEKIWGKAKFKGKAGNVWIKMKRPVCMVLSIFIVIGIVAALLLIVIPAFTRTIGSFVDKVPQYSEKIEHLWNTVVALAGNYAIEIPELQIDNQKIIERISGFIGSFGKTFIDTTIGITSSVVSAVANFVIAFIFSLYIIGQKEIVGAAAKKVIYAVFSTERVKDILDLASLVNRSFTNFVTGQLTEAVIIGMLCFVGMAALKLPFAAVISVMVGFTALIPVFGAFIGTAFGALLILLDTPVKALWFVAFILVLQQLENNLIYPKVVGKSVGLPAIFTLMAVSVGGSVFGVVGMLISVPTFSVLYTLAERWVNKRLKEKEIEM